MRREYMIELPGGDRWSPERQLANPTKWQQALVRAKGAGTPCQCLCRDKGQRPLYITTRNRWLYLARHPETGHLHRTDCRYYSAAADASGLNVYAESALKEGTDGTKTIHLSVPLGRRLEQRTVAITEPPAATAAKPKSQARMTPLGLLHLLWTESDLHVWHPNMAGKRSWAAVRKAIIETAGALSQNRHSLEERLLIFPDQAGDSLHRDVGVQLRTKTHWSHLSSKWVEQLILVGELRALKQGPKATTIILARAPDHRLTLFCSHALEAAWRRSFPELDRFLGGAADDVRLIALLVGELRQAGDKILGDIHSGAFMPTTAEFIPFASSYEKLVARRLIDQTRWFEKPLRYDASKSVLFPDFLLFDTVYPHLPMEVYGRMGDPDYMRRREEKTALYQKLYGAAHHWEWVVDPAHPTAVPPFPPPAVAVVCA